MSNLYFTVACVLVVAVTATTVALRHDNHEFSASRCSKLRSETLCNEYVKDCAWCPAAQQCHDKRDSFCCNASASGPMAPSSGSVCNNSATCCAPEQDWMQGTPVCCKKGSACCGGMFPSCCPPPPLGTCCAGGAPGSIQCCRAPSKCLAGICCSSYEQCGNELCCSGMCMNMSGQMVCPPVPMAAPRRALP